MTHLNKATTRFGILVAMAALLMLGSLPLIGNAQDSSSATPDADELITQGEEIYMNVCIACHQPDGNGIEGFYLPLNNNPLVTLEDPTYLITTVLNGRGGMPRFDTTYSDEEIAAITSYVRQAWDNEADPVSIDEVEKVRAEIEMTTPTPDAQIPAGLDQSTPEASPST